MARRKRLSPEPFELCIETMADNGCGVAIHEERQLEVHDALPGEKVVARYLFGRRMRGQAETLEVLEESADRVEPRCPHFGTCSACTLQHLAMPAQRAFKQGVLLNHFNSAGCVTPARILPPLEGETWHYRRKARLSVRHVAAKGRVLVGFRERDGRFVADISECHILPQVIADRLADMSSLLGSLASRESIPQIEVACGDENAALVIRHLVPLPDPDLDKLRAFSRASGLAVLLQPKGPDSVVPLEPAQPSLSYALPDFGLEYRFEALDFVQVNGGLNRAMIRQALELLEPGPDDRALDLFCGLGNFTLPLARSAGQVLGIEGSEELVARARDNARRNDIANVEFQRADLYAPGGAQAWSGRTFDLVLLDPPRSGAEQVLEAIAASGARRVLYVSCNPATLARDAGILAGRLGYTLAAAGVMDMFPHTAHLESMALFERQ